jgi:hypothetical protein
VNMNAQSGYLSRESFLAMIRAAAEDRAGFATGKLGPSELQLLHHSILAAKAGRESKLFRALKSHVAYQGLKQMALFPPEPDFYLRYFDQYVHHLRKMDCIGVFPELIDRVRTVTAHYNLSQPLIPYLEQEPDRSTPSVESNCYLPYFRDLRILFICSFAGLLCERANQETFEAVWANTGKRWFHPARVEALEFPYGYTAETHRRYRDSSELLEEIREQMARRDFDVALIGAAGLAIPIASYAKQLGKIGISLGGHLQILTGVIGKRWRDRAGWKERYFNDAWIDMPERYRPPETDIADRGAYW